MPSGRDIIARSLRSINVLAAGEVPDASMAADALESLNEMLDTWQADGLMVFTTDSDDFVLNSSQQTYTLGTGGDFNIPRPEHLDRASIIITTNPAQPIEYNLPIYTTQDWQSKVPVKNVTSTLPLLVYDDGEFPLRNLTFWPTGASNCSFRLYSWQPLQSFANLNIVREYPAGYLEAIRFNLAIRLAPEYGKSVSPEIVALAAAAVANIKTQNADDTQLISDVTNDSMTAGQMRAELFGIPSI